MSVSYNVACDLVGRQYRTVLYGPRVPASVRGGAAPGLYEVDKQRRSDVVATG